MSDPSPELIADLEAPYDDGVACPHGVNISTHDCLRCADGSSPGKREQLLLAEVQDLQARLTDTAQLWASALDRITDLEHKVRYLETLVIE